MNLEAIVRFISKLEPYGVYNAAELLQSFHNETNCNGQWPRWSVGTVQDDAHRVCFAFEVAEQLARQYASKYYKPSGFPSLGRGGRFLVAYEALQAALTKGE